MKLFSQKSGSYNSEIQAFNMGLAVCTIAMAGEKLEKESKEENNHEK